jgi:hypothetical protein
LGIIVAPETYRVGNAPTFLPQFAVGNPQGVDRSRWKSWIQNRFDGGSGQIYLGGTLANNRYAESNLVDLGMPINVAGGLAGRTGARGIGVLQAPEPEGQFSAALVPRATTAATPLTDLFSKTLPLFVFEMSNRPHLINQKAMVVLYGAESIFAAGAIDAWRDPLAAGVFYVIATVFPSNVLSAVKFSNVIVTALGDRLWNYDGAIYVPAYSTEADRVDVYDNRLWRFKGSRSAVLTLQPGNTSIPAFVWSDYKDVGDPGSNINNTAPFGGRLYHGRVDGSLHVFDAGRIYPVLEAFKQVRDPSNYNLLLEHKSSLYFNIRQRVYRYFVNGSYEMLQMPDFDGVVVGGASVGDELHILVRTTSGESEVWIFNTETGGVRRWFGSREFAWGSDPNDPQGIGGIGTAYGYVWMAPVQSSASYAAGSPALSYISAANRVSPPRTAYVPFFAKTHSYLITSMVDLGYPNLRKLLGRVNIDYGLLSTGDRIDVYFLTALKGPRILGAFLQDAAAVWYDGTAELTDGSVRAAEGALDVTTTQYDLYILFESPVEAARFIMGEQHVGIGSGSWSYSIAAGWNDISGASLFDFVTEADEPLVTEDDEQLVGLSEGMRINDGTTFLTQTGFILPGDLGDWALVTVQGVTGYGLRYTSPTGASSRIQITEALGIKSLQKQDWVSLGSIGEADLGEAQKTLEFPSNTVSREVMLYFQLWGTDATRPDVKRVEIEHIEERSDLSIIDFVGLALNGIELLDMSLENSGAYIGATLMSLSKSPGLYPVQLPWPVAGNTIRARVSLSEPGAHIPILAYGNSWAGARIPIRLDEM